MQESNYFIYIDMKYKRIEFMLSTAFFMYKNTDFTIRRFWPEHIFNFYFVIYFYNKQKTTFTKKKNQSKLSLLYYIYVSM